MLERIFEIMESTPAKLAGEVVPLTDAELRARPRPHCWSIVEVVAHLDDAEERAMRSRLAAIVEEDHPILQSFDQNRCAQEMRYIDKNAESVLASFTKQRRHNVAWLKTLAAKTLMRVGAHPEVGLISANDLLHEWAFHDLDHLKQILEIKRDGLYPYIGNLQKFYRLQWE